MLLMKGDETLSLKKKAPQKKFNQNNGDEQIH